VNIARVGEGWCPFGREQSTHRSHPLAIAPSKLGRLIADEWSSPDETLIRRLRVLGLVMENAADDDLRATFKKAREEHAALRPGRREFNSPNERVRIFLDPFVTDKDRRWAVPLESLNCPILTSLHKTGTYRRRAAQSPVN